MSLLPLALQQKRLLGKISHPAVRHYLETPLPHKNDKISDTEFLALDFETTGLDPKQEAILSVGYTLIKHNRIRLSENGHHIIRINRSIPAESVVIHKITDTRSKQGQALHDVIELLLDKMAGRALLVHFAAIEKNFLSRAFKALYDHSLPVVIVDTLAIEQKKYQQQQRQYTPTQLRLFNLRKHYGLPRYKAHNALEDAIATAELFLAQIHHKTHDIDSLQLKDVC